MTPRAVIAGLALLVVVPAAAANGPPGAASQYREMLPTAGGEHSTTSGGMVAILPPSILGAIRKQGGGDAPTLEKIATSSRYGAPRIPRRILNPSPRAPKARMHRGAGDTRGKQGRLLAAVHNPGAFEAGLGAAGMPLWLALAGGAITLVPILLAFARRRA